MNSAQAYRCVRCDLTDVTITKSILHKKKVYEVSELDPSWQEILDFLLQTPVFQSNNLSSSLTYVKVSSHSQGSIINYAIASVHYDPRYWKQPEKFLPERWLDAEGKFNTKKEGFLPFGVGTWLQLLRGIISYCISLFHCTDMSFEVERLSVVFSIFCSLIIYMSLCFLSSALVPDTCLTHK